MPTAISGPGFNNGGQLRELTSLVDLPPTLLDAANIEIPASMQGRSVLPLVNRENADWPGEVFVQISESEVGRAVRTRRWKYCVHAPDKNGNRDSGASHYVEQFLYDLRADPWELHNLVGRESHREVADVMKERLIKRMVEAGEAAPTIEDALPLGSGQRRVSSAEALQ